MCDSQGAPLAETCQIATDDKVGGLQWIGPAARRHHAVS
jgi:hypothetical protein